MGILDVFLNMGVLIEIVKEMKEIVEFYVDLVVEVFYLKGMEVGGDLILCLIDEILIIVLVVI